MPLSQSRCSGRLPSCGDRLPSLSNYYLPAGQAMPHALPDSLPTNDQTSFSLLMLVFNSPCVDLYSTGRVSFQPIHASQVCCNQVRRNPPARLVSRSRDIPRWAPWDLTYRVVPLGRLFEFADLCLSGVDRDEPPCRRINDLRQWEPHCRQCRSHNRLHRVGQRIGCHRNGL